jgi:phage/plasmid-like protein (TIGR03299 family)
MPIDVNEEFARERSGQAEAARAWAQKLQERLAGGQVRQMPDGRYKVLEGWDKGETLDARGMPEHGLDVSTGEAALYTAVPAWHHLGQVVLGGTADIDEVLRLGKIDYQVETVPALYSWNGTTRVHEGQRHTVRSDTGAALGVVGPDYHVIQPREGFEFLQVLVNDHQVVWESAGALRGGRKVFVTMRIPGHVTVDPSGINDEVVPFIEAVNSYDGRSPFEVVVTPWRTVCANTERFSVRDAVSRWKVRHTRNATGRIHEARRTLGLTVSYYDAWAAEETALARTDLAIDQFNELIDELWPVDQEATARVRRTAEARRERLHQLFGEEADKHTGRTAYGAERAVTGYLDHFAPLRPSAASGVKGNLPAARGLRLLEGTDDERKSAAHRRLMLMRRG